MIPRSAIFASIVVISLLGAGLAQAQITPRQIPVFIDANGNTMDSFIAQPGGNPRSPIQITDGITYAAPTLWVRNSGGGVGHAVFAISETGSGVVGQSNSGSLPGVRGVAVHGGSGVVGEMALGSSGFGVFGYADVGHVSRDSAGVMGDTFDGIGVYGSTGRGIAVYGNASEPNIGYAGVFEGKVKVNVLGSGGSTSLCRNSALEIATCSSSLRYKTDVRPFTGGLEIVKRLRPIAFSWKQDGAAGIGLAAEDVEKAEPLLVFRNDQGEVEGVRYNELSAVFVNAFVQQQAQIQRQQEQINALRSLLCQSRPDAEVCR